jgi:sortase (surface protein transpeptidase)
MRVVATHRPSRTALLAAALAVTGGTMLAAGVGGQLAGRPPAAVAAPAVPVPPAVPAAPVDVPAMPALARSTPVRLSIPAIGVDTELITLGINADGTLAVPPLARNAPAGWYRYLPSPGETGPAVIVGHVATARYGPAVFFRLATLRRGDRVTVRRADRTTAVFTVVAVAQYRKTRFPTTAVYGPVDHPALRLITCGGSFDRSRGRYRDSVVVYAALTGVSPPR